MLKAPFSRFAAILSSPWSLSAALFAFVAVAAACALLPSWLPLLALYSLQGYAAFPAFFVCMLALVFAATRARSWWEERRLAGVVARAAGGDAAAAFELGARAGPKGFAWLERAAQLGHAEAQFRVARDYVRTHRGDKALPLLQSAARQGHVGASFDIGESLYFNKVWTRGGDLEMARLLRIAADAGFVLAAFYLVQCYLRGTGVDKDRIAAGKWLDLARRRGVEDTMTAFDINDLAAINEFLEDASGGGSSSGANGSLPVAAAPRATAAASREAAAAAERAEAERVEMIAARRKARDKEKTEAAARRNAAVAMALGRASSAAESDGSADDAVEGPPPIVEIAASAGRAPLISPEQAPLSELDTLASDECLLPAGVDAASAANVAPAGHASDAIAARPDADLDTEVAAGARTNSKAAKAAAAKERAKSKAAVEAASAAAAKREK